MISPAHQNVVRKVKSLRWWRFPSAPIRSAALLVVQQEKFPLVDLRVDAAERPIAALRALWQEYLPWVDEFVVRAIDPDRARGGS